MPISGSEVFSDFIFREFEQIYGGMWGVEPDPGKMAEMMIDHINKKREDLGISETKKRILYDMEMRRELDI